MASEARQDPVREFIRAFNEHDLDGFVATLHPEVEIHAGRGMRKGPEAARIWATKKSGGAQQTIVLDALYEETDRAVALITRRWHWDEDRSHAGEEEMAWLFELEDGLVRGWRPFDDRGEGLRAGGFRA
jgi:limonene-1,2-epoxide hydrolase